MKRVPEIMPIKKFHPHSKEFLDFISNSYPDAGFQTGFSERSSSAYADFLDGLTRSIDRREWRSDIESSSAFSVGYCITTESYFTKNIDIFVNTPGYTNKSDSVAKRRAELTLRDLTAPWGFTGNRSNCSVSVINIFDLPNEEGHAVSVLVKGASLDSTGRFLRRDSIVVTFWILTEMMRRGRMSSHATETNLLKYEGLGIVHALHEYAFKYVGIDLNYFGKMTMTLSTQKGEHTKTYTIPENSGIKGYAISNPNMRVTKTHLFEICCRQGLMSADMFGINRQTSAYTGGDEFKNQNPIVREFIDYLVAGRRGFLFSQQNVEGIRAGLADHLSYSNAEFLAFKNNWKAEIVTKNSLADSTEEWKDKTEKDIFTLDYQKYLYTSRVAETLGFGR